MLERIRELKTRALFAIAAGGTEAEVEGALREVLGAKGGLLEVLRGIGSLPAAQRGPVGREANEARREVESAAEARLAALRAAREGALGDAEWVDSTLPGPRRGGGTLHPVAQTCREVEDTFLRMGFSLADGPWVEDDFHNFEALNIPPDHPARDLHDTFWLTDGTLLRTHTSPVQVRLMRRSPPPIRSVAIGRVFRNEDLDATHEHTFHQVEGLLVDRDVSVAHMLYVLQTFLRELLGQDLEVRLRPSYFPFVEPGFELDVTFRGRWLELLGCGLVHPRVLEAGGIDPDAYGGFAFGMGIDRLVMLRYGVEDIRHFTSGELRFLSQFRGGMGA
jgi:phenylalanyl-tRNA synthetase alpha chain